MNLEHKILTLIDRGVTERDLICRVVGRGVPGKINALTPTLIHPKRLRLTRAGVARLNELDEIEKEKR